MHFSISLEKRITNLVHLRNKSISKPKLHAQEQFVKKDNLSTNTFSLSPTRFATACEVAAIEEAYTFPGELPVLTAESDGDEDGSSRYLQPDASCWTRTRECVTIRKIRCSMTPALSAGCDARLKNPRLTAAGNSNADCLSLDVNTLTKRFSICST